jgi:hypothetical protein
MILTSNRGLGEWGEVFGDPSSCGRDPDRGIKRKRCGGLSITHNSSPAGNG